MPEVVQSLSTARAVSLNHQFTFQARNQLTEALAHMAGHGSAASYVARLRARTSVVTLLAGSGTRWEESVRLAKELGAFQENWEPGTPRALFPIDDILRPGQKIPIGGYTLRAARELGKHIVVTSGTHDERIEQELVSPLNLSASFVTQEKYGDTVNAAGHADAMWQSKDAWQDSEYVIVNFGGNANARATLISSLMLLDLLNKEKETCGEIVLSLIHI